LVLRAGRAQIFWAGAACGADLRFRGWCCDAVCRADGLSVSGLAK